MKKKDYIVEVDVFNNVEKGEIGRHIHHEFELGYHVNVEPVIYEQEANPLAGTYFNAEYVRYQITLLKEVN